MGVSMPWDGEHGDHPLRVSLARGPMKSPGVFEDVTCLTRSRVGISSPWRDWLSQPDPRTCSLELVNNDGRFSDLTEGHLRVSYRRPDRPANMYVNGGFDTGITGWSAKVFFGAALTTAWVQAPGMRLNAADKVLRVALSSTANDLCQVGATQSEGLVVGRRYEQTAFFIAPAGKRVWLGDPFGASTLVTATGSPQVLRRRFTATSASGGLLPLSVESPGSGFLYVGMLRLDEGWSTLPTSDDLPTPTWAGSEPSPAVIAAGYSVAPLNSVVSHRFTGTFGTPTLIHDGDIPHAAITAADLSSPLAATVRPFAHPVIEEALQTSPVGLWPLDERDSATAGDRTGKAKVELVSTSANAAAVGTDLGGSSHALTGPIASFDGTGWLITGDDITLARPLTDWTVAATIVTTASDGLVAALGDDWGPRYRLRVTPTGALAFDIFDIWSGQVTNTIGSGVLVNDGRPRHVAMRGDYIAGPQLAATLYVDGAVVGYAAFAHPVTAAPRLYVGGGSQMPGFVGAIGHVTYWQRAIDSAEVATIAAGATTGWAGESTHARLQRYARWAGVADKVEPQSGHEGTMGPLDTTGKRPWDAMRDCATVEAMPLSVTGSGLIRLRPRATRYNPAAVTLDSCQIQGGLTHGTDLGLVINDITVTRGPGSETQRVTDDASIAARGPRDRSLTIPAATSAQARSVASWIVGHHANPVVKVDGVHVLLSSDDLTADDAGTVLGLDHADALTITDLPGADMPQTTETMRILGWSETWGHDGPRWHATSTWPVGADANVLIWDHPTKGVLDTVNVWGI